VSREGEEVAAPNLVVPLPAVDEGDGSELILILGLDVREGGVVVGRVVDLRRGKGKEGAGQLGDAAGGRRGARKRADGERSIREGVVAGLLGFDELCEERRGSAKGLSASREEESPP
jgi:hypothetical protein